MRSVIIGFVVTFFGLALEVQAGCAGVTNAYGRTSAQQAACDEMFVQQMNNDSRAAQARTTLQTQCYADLFKETDKDICVELGAAITCLTGSPYTNASNLGKFYKLADKMVEAKADGTSGCAVGEQLNALKAQKAKKLYWKQIDSQGTVSIIVPDSYDFFELAQGKRYAEALGVLDVASEMFQVTRKSHMFGSDDRVALKDVKSLNIGFQVRNQSLQNYPGHGDYSATVTDSQTTTEDEMYTRSFPICYEGLDKSRCASLGAINGLVYSFNPNFPQASQAKRIAYSTHVSDLAYTAFSLVSEEEAKQWIGKTQEVLDRQAKASKDEKAKAQAAYEAVVEKFKTARLGSEDSCEGALGYGKAMGDSTVLSCQLTATGAIALSMIKQSGWLVTNVSQTGNGNTQRVIVIIKKAK